MKKSRNYKIENGQSLIELAIFASVVFLAMGTLVSYALSYNFQQRLNFKVFREARKLAEDVSKTYRSASIIMLYDKARPDISNLFGFGQRVPVAGSSSASYGLDLYAQMAIDKIKNPDGSTTYIGKDEELPRAIYQINGKNYILKAAAFRYKAFSRNNAKRKEFIDDWDGKGISWRWECPKNTPKSECNRGLGHISKEKFRDYTSWDIDGDEEEEIILNRGAGLVVDSQEGQIDMSEDEPELRNGLLPDTFSVEEGENLLTNEQQNRQKTTATKLEHKYIIERRIRLNPKISDTDLKEVISQININNQYCYKTKWNFYDLDADKEGIKETMKLESASPDAQPCAEEEKDSLLTITDGTRKVSGRFIVIRSKFTKSGTFYNWVTND